MDSGRRTRRHNRLHSNTFWHRHLSQQPDTHTANTLASIDDAEQDINILILGDRGTGKTCLNSRYVLRQFVNTGGAAQLTGGHKLVTVDPPAPLSASTTSTAPSTSSQVHLIVQDFPCGPWQETIDNRVPDGNVPLTGEYIYATLQSDFRQSLLTRADAVMLVCNPWSKSSFEWIDGVKNDGSESPLDGEDGGLVNEVLEAARRKNLTRRVGLLLDSLSESTSSHYYRKADENNKSSKSTDTTRTPTALGRPAPQLSVTLPGDELRAKKDKLASPTSTPYDFELEYPVLVVGTASDRLAEYGGDLPRKVRKADGEALARRFRLHADDNNDNNDNEDPDARKADGTLYTSRYMEVSAQKNENVDEAFMWLIQRVLEQKARARERKRRQDAVAAVRRRVTETQQKQSHQSIGFWAASMLWASQEAVTSAVQGCFGSGSSRTSPTKAASPVAAPAPIPLAPVNAVPCAVAPTASLPMSMDQTAAAEVLSPIVEQPVGYAPSPVQSRSATPVEDTADNSGIKDLQEEISFSRTTTSISNADSDTASLPSLVSDTMSLNGVQIPNGHLFRSESRGPSTPIAVEPLPRPDAGMGKAGQQYVGPSRRNVWV